MTQKTMTVKLPPADQASLRERLSAEHAEFRSVDHAFWQARIPGLIATFYKSGKLVLQGASAEAWAADTGGALAEPRKKKSSGPKGDPHADGPFAAAVAKLPDPKPTAWIGVDEAGKGDYFGALVVCAARVQIDQLPLLAELGVGDSKTLTDKRAKSLASQLKGIVPFHKITLRPPQYNALYAKIGNLNRLLAWAHAASAKALLEETDAELMLSDQFAKRDIISGRLKDVEGLRFTQRTKAEDDPAVACASIFARAEFLWTLEALAKEHSLTLPKGAGGPVLSAARRIVHAEGPHALADVAKLHFKTTEKAGA